jgi:predicted alpha/beta superfamily hydrolase
MTEPMTVLNSEVRMMHSLHTNKLYRITISLPLGYAAPDGEGWPFNNMPDKWPVVYVLDGNWYAGMVAGIIRPMAWCGSTSDAIVVGIGYPEDANIVEAIRDSFTRRDYDLTPVRDEAVEQGMEQAHGRPTPNGGAGQFLRFLKDELMPVIERDYRADRRILVGHSYGGLFGLYAMFEAPDLFDTLIIGSPTLTYGNRFTFGQEEAFAKAHTKLAANVYLFVGELEEGSDNTTMTDTLRMGAILQGRKYEGFSLVKQVFADQNHCEVAAPGIQWGLKQALKKS